MKKLFYLLVGILILIPIKAQADMASPLVISYKASVNNPNGVDDYEMKIINNEAQWVKTGKKISYGTIFEINEEDMDYICNNDYCAKYSDLVAVEKDYKLKPEEIGDEVSLTTIKETIIKSGPAQAYETIGKIESNETIKAKNVIAFNEAEEGGTPWYYVEYNGVKGYISELDDSFADSFKEADIMIIEDTDLFDLNKNKVKTLKTFETMSVKYAVLNGYNGYMYIETNDFKGYVKYDYVSIKEDVTEFKTTDEITVYEYADQYNAKVIATIPKDTVFASEYYYTYQAELYVYYEKDNIKGFAFTEDYEYDETNNTYILGASETTEEKIKEEPKKEETKDEPKKETVKKPKNNNNTTLFICIGAGIILSLTAIITIILINKKRKQKEL